MSEECGFIETDNESVTDETIEELIGLKKPRPKRQKVQAPARYRNQIQDAMHEALLEERFRKS